jgi:Fanconi anemia group J protein
MQINLKDSVVILDEAHNIEDICRQVVNVDLRDDDLNVAAKECEKLSKDRVANCNTYSTIQNYLSDTVKFLDIIDVKHNVSTSYAYCTASID